MAKYQVKNWDTQAVLLETDSLAEAKKFAKAQGSVNHPPFGVAPVARVVNEAGECVYNPKFTVHFTPVEVAALKWGANGRQKWTTRTVKSQAQFDRFTADAIEVRTRATL